MALEKEMQTYARELPNLVADEGKFVLIKGDQVAGVFTSYDDALKIGYEKFGLESFLVKQIQAVQQVQFFTRDLTPCPT